MNTYSKQKWKSRGTKRKSFINDIFPFENQSQDRKMARNLFHTCHVWTKLKLISRKRHKHWGNASKYASILSVPVESELDFTTKIETFSDQVEVKEEYDDFIYEEAIEKRNNVEYSKNKEVDQISDHVENDFNSNLDIKLEHTEDDQSRPKIHL